MITKTGKVNPYLETDNESQKELVNLFNAWEADTCFLSSCSWIDTNENWKKMKEYCMENKDLVKDFGWKCTELLVKLDILHLCCTTYSQTQ